ncbi:MAG TPA: TasA family protein [Chloroflexota bacterium]|nr:TasA family protein [Chloroflexota bacterium]
MRPRSTSLALHLRSKSYGKLALSALLIVGALGLLIGGAFATFTDEVPAGPQAITSGTVKIQTGPTNDAATGATNIAAGDTIAREIDLNSTGATLADQKITLQFSASPSSLLDTDATNGLQVGIQSCATPWTRTVVGSPPPPFTYTCSGGATTVTINGAATASVSSLETTPGTLGSLNSLTPGGHDYLVYTLTLPSGAPGDLSKVAACSGTPGGTATTEDLQGCASTLTYTFQATQRTAGGQ